MERSDTRIEDFKRVIDFEARAEPPNTTEGVCAAWPDPRDAPALAGNGWMLPMATTSIFYPCAEKRWVMRRGEERAVVTITVSSAGPRPVQQHFLSAAAATIMPEIGYLPAYDDLGTVCVGESRADDELLMWLFRNVLFQVTTFYSDLDTESLGRWLQDTAALHRVDPLAGVLPRIRELRLSANRMRVGQHVKAEAVLEQTDGPLAEPIRYEVEGSALIRSEGATIEARHAGRGLVRAMRFDPATLLLGSSASFIDVDT